VDAVEHTLGAPFHYHLDAAREALHVALELLERAARWSFSDILSESALFFSSASPSLARRESSFMA
jgi:hypothetical protein